jgi:tetratricopeptide (TPR) repeat protein
VSHSAEHAGGRRKRTAEWSIHPNCSTLNRAIALRPTYAAAYNGLGMTFKEQGRLEKAIAAYSRAIELNPAIRRAPGRADPSPRQ